MQVVPAQPIKGQDISRSVGESQIILRAFGQGVFTTTFCEFELSSNTFVATLAYQKWKDRTCVVLVRRQVTVVQVRTFTPPFPVPEIVVSCSSVDVDRAALSPAVPVSVTSPSCLFVESLQDSLVCSYVMVVVPYPVA